MHKDFWSHKGRFQLYSKKVGTTHTSVSIFIADSEWYILRMCKSEVMVEMYLSPDMCIGESRPGSGHMCTCMAERCNHATAISAPNYILLVYTALMGLLLHYSNHHLLGLS